jgi:hypothetical protein
LANDYFCIQKFIIMAENIPTPKVVLKKKQIPVLVDFCLDEAIEFSVRQQVFPETDWEIELKLKDFKVAILVGMFLRENRFDIDGIDASRYKKSNGSAKKADDKAEPVKQEMFKPEPVRTEAPRVEEDLQSPTLM